MDEHEASLAPANLGCTWMVTSLLTWSPFRTSSWPPETSVVQVWGFDLLRVINKVIILELFRLCLLGYIDKVTVLAHVQVLAL